MRKIICTLVLIVGMLQAGNAMSGVTSTVTFDYTRVTSKCFSSSLVPPGNYPPTPCINFDQSIRDKPYIMDWTYVKNGVILHNFQGQGSITFNDIFGTNNDQIPFNSTIQSAYLSLFVSEYSTIGVGQISIYQILNPYPYHLSAKSGGGPFMTTMNQPDSIVSTNAKTNNRMIFDVTESLRNWSLGFSNYGWDLVMNHQIDRSNQGAVIMEFVGKEGTSSYDSPRLTVNFTSPDAAIPIPGTVWLFGSGLLGLFGLKRKLSA